MSESIANIAAALAAFQGEAENPKNTANNPYYKSKYAPLPEILNLVRPLMSKHGLSILQMPSGDGENITVTGFLMHTSGEWIEFDPLTLRADKITAQGAGSAITYARRYQLAAVLGISSEDDDDGNIASKNGRDEASKQADKVDIPNPIPNSGPKPLETTITSSQRNMIFALAKGAKLTEDDLHDKVQEKYNVDSITKLSKRQASELIEELKNAANKNQEAQRV